MTDPTEWLLKWFEQRGTPVLLPLDQVQTLNYFQAGLLDSFGVIELIGQIEAYFNIRFEQDNFQDRRFAMIGGLSEIIGELATRRNA